MSEDKVVLVTGGFDPIHSGHLALIKEARKLGRVVVGLNSDAWLIRKKGKPFQSFDERFLLLSALKDVLCVISFNDEDGSAINAIKQAQFMFPSFKLVFANGGDRTQSNIPELAYCTQNDVEVVFGIGGETKKNSSSWILSSWVTDNFENRVWGKFKTLYTDGTKVKVKELTLDPGKSISLQRHQHRNEFWVIVSGKAMVQTNDVKTVLNAQDWVHITPNMLHKVTNIGEENLKILEVQHGAVCDENDIERIQND